MHLLRLVRDYSRKISLWNDEGLTCSNSNNHSGCTCKNAIWVILFEVVTELRKHRLMIAIQKIMSPNWTNQGQHVWPFAPVQALPEVHFRSGKDHFFQGSIQFRVVSFPLFNHISFFVYLHHFVFILDLTSLKQNILLPTQFSLKMYIKNIFLFFRLPYYCQ